MYHALLLTLIYVTIGHDITALQRESITRSSLIHTQTISSEQSARSTWMWTSVTELSDTEIKNLIVQSRTENISTIYVSLDPYLTAYESKASAEEIATIINRYAYFIQAAHDSNISIQGLAGNTNWHLTDYSYIPKLLMQFVIEFNATQVRGFDGIQFDIEPYSRSVFWKNQTEESKLFLELVTETRDELEQHLGKDFQLGFALPYWFDGENSRLITVPWAGQQKYLTEHVIDILDQSTLETYIVLMAYRNNAEGSDGTIQHVIGEADYIKNNASSVGLLVGQETTNVQPEKITFFNLSIDDFTQQEKAITAAMSGYSSYKGIAIHHIESFFELINK